MKTVLVTGAAGFIGKNLCAQLEQEKDVTVLPFGRDNTPDELEKYIKQSDFIFHLAGVNRPKDEAEFLTGNSGLTEQIISVLEASGRETPLLITSSAQAALDNPYGRSKRAAEEAVFKWSDKSSAPVYVYRLPGVFGKWSKPNYNSVVATFCHNIANGLDIKVNDPDAKLELVYIDDVVADFIDALKGKKKPNKDRLCSISRCFSITLQELADTIYSFEEIRTSLLLPDFDDNLNKFLYATYTSYLPRKSFSYALKTNTDQRGWLAEFIKSPQVGQVFVSQTKPGYVRGNHWHHTKIEKFLVLAGEAEVIFKDLHSSDEFTYQVNGEKLEVVDIPAGYLHTLKNTGKSDLITLIWADEILDPEKPDTYYMEAE